MPINKEELKQALDEVLKEGYEFLPRDFSITLKTKIFTNLFKFGTVNLVNGTATIIDSRIKESSVALVSRRVAGGTIGDLRIITGNGQATITSSSNTDTSSVFYFIIL